MQNEDTPDTPDNIPAHIHPQQQDVYDQATILLQRKRSSRDRFHRAWGINPENLLPHFLERRDKELGRTTLEVLSNIAEKFPLEQAASTLQDIVQERIGKEAHVGQSRRPRLTRSDVTEAMSRLVEKTKLLPKRGKRKTDVVLPDVNQKRPYNPLTSLTEYPTPEQARSARPSLPEEDSSYNLILPSDNTIALYDQHPPSSPLGRSINRFPAETPLNVPLEIPVRRPFEVFPHLPSNDPPQPQNDKQPSLFEEVSTAEDYNEALTQSIHAAWTEFEAKLNHARHSYRQAILQSINDANRVRTRLEAAQEDAMRSRTTMEEAIGALEEALKVEDLARKKAQDNSSIIRVYEREALSDEIKGSMAEAYQIALGYESQKEAASEATAAAYNIKESCHDSLNDIEERLQELEKEQRRVGQIKDQCAMTDTTMTRFIGHMSSAASDPAFALLRANPPL
ncbi:MAG: hypothetical protein Q9220_006167 [cf. Caloplaca sp. 1 TL-2023]